MKKYLIKLNHGGASKGCHSYTLTAAKNPESAIKKVQREIDTFYRHSMHPPEIAGAHLVGVNTESDLRVEVAALRMKLAELEREVKNVKAKLYDTQEQLSAFEDFTEAAQDCCSAR